MEMEIIVQAIAALAALIGAMLAILQVLRPKLKLSLLSSQGEKTRYGDSPDAPLTYFYHLIVTNHRRPRAKNFYLKLIRISKAIANEIFPDGYLTSPVELRWAREKNHPCTLDIAGRNSATCNFGFIIKNQKFQLDPCVDPWPPNFQGFININEGGKMKVEVVAVADNARSNTLCVEIDWDGKWSDVPAEMNEKHLHVKEVRSSN